MKVLDHQIPDDMNWADICDKLRNESRERPASRKTRPEEQILADVMPQEKVTISQTKGTALVHEQES